MLLDSIKNAKEDVKIKALIEARNEANNIILSTEKFLNQHAELFTDEEFAPLILIADKLKEVVKGEDKDAIHDIIHQLDKIARPMAEKAMDYSIRQSLAGKSIV